MDFDVIIVGAGPAGLACARELAGSAFSVLLLDKASVLGSKPCGGGICEKEVAVPCEAAWVKKFAKQIISLGQSSVTINHRYKRITFEREDLASYQERLLQDAKKITLLKNVLVTEILPGSIATDQGRYHYNDLVGADGSASIVRAYLQLPNKLAWGMYYRIWGTHDEVVAYYDPRTMGPGYIWEFPHATYNNIGIYFEPCFLEANKAKAILQKYLRKRNYPFDEKDFLAAPINYNYMGHQFGNIYLIGDAGGFACRMHGGGISNAVISGTEIAKLIQDARYTAKPLKDMIHSKQSCDRLVEYFAMIPLWLTKGFILMIMQLYRMPFFQKILPL
ncbi:MAG: NAD(P)/FAD-dependent oxidoreductase [bacterium]|nr:NAD(P)/FAD-dependent oxidoreductase [bacterium]